MKKKTNLVCGVGFNDANYKVYLSTILNGKKKNIWVCPFYKTWSNMLARCEKGGSYQNKKPTYIGCIVSSEWHSFRNFKDWMEDQAWIGNDLDKDLLFSGNKIYSSVTCVFIDTNLNRFLKDRNAILGGYPSGVYLNKKQNKFMAQCGNPFTKKSEFLGLFECQNKAHEAWLARKHEHACRYADMQTDQRIAQALRIRYAKQATQ